MRQSGHKSRMRKREDMSKFVLTVTIEFTGATTPRTRDEELWNLMNSMCKVSTGEYDADDKERLILSLSDYGQIVSTELKKVN